MDIGERLPPTKIWHQSAPADCFELAKNQCGVGTSGPAKQPAKAPSCPKCASRKTFLNGGRFYRGIRLQRYLCSRCGFRFSDSITKFDVEVHVGSQVCKASQAPNNVFEAAVGACDLSSQKPLDGLSFRRSKDVSVHGVSSVEKGLNGLRLIDKGSQLCVEKAKKLAEQKQEITLAGGTISTNADIQGKLVSYLFHMDVQGYKQATIRLHRVALKTLAIRGANLFNPESVKETICKQKVWSQSRKRNVVNAYSSFLKYVGLTWEKPKVQVSQKIPFIPTETEIDTLVAGTGPKLSTFLQTLKETAMRSGEAKRLQWINIDAEKKTVTLNEPEKNSNPRIWRVSQKLIGMLESLPKKSETVFGDGPINSLKTTFLRTRKRLAAKLQNPRLLQISFHTFRHWKATYEYHRTKDPYYVKQFLGHKSLKNTEIYITIERTLFEPGNDEFTVKVTEKPEEIKSLLETGFEYVCQNENLTFLRKRK